MPFCVMPLYGCLRYGYLRYASALYGGIRRLSAVERYYAKNTAEVWTWDNP